MQYNPPSGSANPNAPYVGKNVAAGTQGSRVPRWAVEADQREIVHVIDYAGFTPTNDDLEQLRKAIQKICRDLFDEPGSDLKLNQGLFLLKAQRAPGVPPRALSSSFQAWQLNTVLRNTIPGASIANTGEGATYRITLPAGRYRVFGVAHANRSGQHRCRLYKPVTATVIDLGTTADSYANSENGTTNSSALRAFFELTEPTLITFEHAGLGTTFGDGYFGDSDGTGANSDAYLEILRELGQS